MRRVAWLVTLAASAAAQTPARQWASYWAAEYGVPAALVHAVIEVESGWNPVAVSARGAAGLMQLMPRTAWAHSVTNRFDIAENTRGGVAHLARLWRRFEGDWRLAVAAYYTGEPRIARHGLAFSDAEVHRHVEKVGRAYGRAGARQAQVVEGGEP